MIAVLAAIVLVAPTAAPMWPPPPEPRSLLFTIVPEPTAEPRPEDICAPGANIKVHRKAGRKWVTCE